jgi:hypothetical protein
MSIFNLGKKVLDLPNPHPFPHYPTAQINPTLWAKSNSLLWASAPYVHVIRQLLVEKNGLYPNELVVSHLTLYYEGANDSSVVIGFPLDHTVTNGPCNLHFNWSYKDIFIGWSVVHNRYYVTAESHGIFFEELCKLEDSLAILEKNIQQAINDY